MPTRFAMVLLRAAPLDQFDAPTQPQLQRVTCSNRACAPERADGAHLNYVDHRNTVMIKLLRGLFGKTPREHPAKKPMLIARPKRSNTGGDFRAVSLAPSIRCCAAAKQATGRRVLLREAPRLPLEGCTMPTNCSCKFRKDADRRDSDRRLLGATEANRWFAGPESRKRGGRRSTAT